MNNTKNIEIPKGYKQTKVGVIPQNWEVKRLGELCGNICGEYGANESAIPYSDGMPRYIRITDIEDNGNLTNEFVSADLTKEEIDKFKLEYGDLLFARTGATVGKTYLHLDKEAYMVYAGFLIRFRLNTDKVIPKLIKEFTNTGYYWNWVETYSARSGQPGLNSQEYQSLHLPIPPLAEQEQIASCLTTWDSGIEKLSTLIEAKKEQKKGLMQQLLTGKKRLEGFTEEWREVKLGEIAKRITKRNEELNDNVVTISAQRGFVRQEEYFNKRVASATLTNYYLVERGDFCYNKSYSNGYPMGAIKRLTDYEKAVVTTLYICFRAKSNVNVDFLNYYFEHGLLNKGLTKVAQEGGRAHGLLNIGINDFFGLKLILPSIEEQVAIANILNKTDQEISLLEQKLEAMKEQKRGLMQVLLTGRKRLIDND